ncbi:MAG: YggT family protein [Candidatus Brocadiae bacterium]|nr:YggT family protein [Candidatus Brocadiia bacterium]
MYMIKLLVAVLRIYTFVLIAHAVFSWLPPERRGNEVYRFIEALTGPVLRPLRRILPPVAGLDLSVIVAIIAVEVLGRFLLGLAR